mmetsp:Transcript_12791/g.24286  ORF Transcript_12791/g.24286 Transcript_12791/m.24286 type:complete len:525 (+) Transcript_12791:223-1797(+)|eukprot:CAMPEP_0114232022 /NCGR_PEP_ID=MMETSP0058-20121206/4376_1 /TAXON_ID=36894 /ORGANISM="Pyramimonas parkeae, CCMP726" /LENGTH=524 /DNA_ID=CAMNT_0001343451 /DNA_START=139 /DNA_END=1713 /DNA_ORIENTATION=-
MSQAQYDVRPRIMQIVAVLIVLNVVEAAMLRGQDDMHPTTDITVEVEFKRSHVSGGQQTGAHSISMENSSGCSQGDCGEPLMISPLLETGAIEEARRLAAVDGLTVTSYAGFITVSPVKSLYFWYFPKLSEEGPSDTNGEAPLVVWLQGGPGGSSLFGLFVENGPLGVDANLDVYVRKTSWATKYNMLFIDSPVGAGFSFTSSDDGYCTNTKHCVAGDLYSLMLQFYQLFPELASQPLYITGESYGGHYVPALAHMIHERNTEISKSNLTDGVVPLAGIAIGDGWVDPVHQIPVYPELMYNLGLVNRKQRRVVQDYCDRAVAHLRRKEYYQAFVVWDELINGDVYPYPNYFHNATGLSDYDNYLNTEPPADFGWYSKFLNQPSVRKQIHVGSLAFQNGKTCEKHLLADFHQSFAEELTTLLDSGMYKVLIYSGQLDVIISAASTEAMLFHLQWSQQDKFLDAKRSKWYADPASDSVSGYVQSTGPLTYVVLRKAGHIVPYDQPVAALDMITRFVEGTPFAKENS